MSTALRASVEAMGPAERAALANGRILRLDRLSADAGEVLRGTLPSAFRYDAGPTLPDEAFFASLRSAAGDGGDLPVSEQQWQESVDRLRQELLQKWLLAGTDWLTAMAAEAIAAVVIERPDGVPLSAEVALPGATSAQPGVAAEWDEASLVEIDSATDDVHALLVSQAQAQRRQARTVRVTEDGAVTLAVIAGWLSTWRPHRAAPAVAERQLYVSAGNYEVSFMAEAVQLASGLVWRSDGHIPTLGHHSQHWVKPRAEAPSLRALYRSLAPTGAVEGPFQSDEVLALEPRDRVLEWQQLSEEQRRWLRERARPVTITDGGAQMQLGGQVSEAALRSAQVRFRLAIRWMFTAYAPVVLRDRPRVYFPLGSVAYRLSVRAEE